jgi:hypothetical protein
LAKYEVRPRDIQSISLRESDEPGAIEIPLELVDQFEWAEEEFVAADARVMEFLESQRG